MQPRNAHPTDTYPTIPYQDVKTKPIGTAKFQEPIFTRGQFTGQYIEVIVSVYPFNMEDPNTGQELVAVRFGQMNVIRFLDPNYLYEVQI
jgi:hypothetical protein